MAKQETGALFEESSQGAVSAVTAIVFLVSIVLVLGGFVVMSYGVNPELGPAEVWTFAGGLAATTLGFALPFSLLPLTGK
ncbi:hypothetical protein ACWGOE_00760 [Leucobacter chromiiresistens]|uniref:Uncharacterized protein n=1 Tax=Leucobacter chromiiresistens TaxID=1079994 RepID=A0A1H1BR38_9MICO|nr:hypothetical protein [Leucobacter chromiiresistens]SDQ54411.1 hypothetical protein SAMN04488565_2991 [Leucobacter chromiiresistens]